MARLALTPDESVGKFPTTPLTVNSADVTWTAAGADFVDGAGFPLTGREVLLVNNKNIGAQTITISSVVDEKNRKDDITAYSIGIGEMAFFHLGVKGWRQADGKLYFAVTAADVELAVLRLPPTI